MAQFDLYRLADGTLVVDLQTDLIGLEATRIVAPLREEGVYTVFPGVTPVATVETTKPPAPSGRTRRTRLLAKSAT